MYYALHTKPLLLWRKLNHRGVSVTRTGRSYHLNKGFTLVELLVVIAIISILAGLLLPALGRALEVARTVACANKQKQCYLYLMAYADDSNGHWTQPYTSYKDSSNTTQWRGWAQYLHGKGPIGITTDYTEKGLDTHACVFFCNSFPPLGQYMKYYPDRSYGMPSDYGWSSVYRTTSRIESHSKTFWFADTARYTGTEWTQLCYIASSYGRIHTRHRDLANVAFFDGHVQAARAFELVNGGKEEIRRVGQDSWIGFGSSEITTDSIPVPW